MTDEKRQHAGRNKLGWRRYLRYVAAFDHLTKCYEEGYYLESIAILDSLIGDRLASRLGYLANEEVSVNLTLGKLCSKLLDPPSKTTSPLEVHDDFRRVVGDIRTWTKQRNAAIHATAKIIRDDSDERSFDDLIRSNRINVERGIELLRAFDALDTAARKKNRKTPATHPNAFFPEKRSRVEERRRAVDE